ncbi:HGxxPAAW family protein [Microlunatus speluncae]|uniref:HGxxPAAW family protein n=1 Tax=Microlunatus speluncae TaxID=2594267 RepID=UPI0012666DBB|nr:HGxxPAAW family protein [Microlunatus speluncae]
MTDTSSASDTASAQPRVKHVHHGRTPAAWTGVTIAMIGFIVGGIAMVTGPNWTLFWISVAILVVSLIVTGIMRKLGHGAV